MLHPCLTPKSLSDMVSHPGCNYRHCTFYLRQSATWADLKAEATMKGKLCSLAGEFSGMPIRH